MIHIKKGDKHHHIHHLKEHDGSSRHVHLGTDAHDAHRNLIHLKKERLDHTKKINRDIDNLQHRLNQLAEHGRPIDHKLAEVKKNHYRHKIFDDMISKHTKKGKPEQVAILATLVVCSGIFLLYLFGNPTLTGNSVLNADIESTKILLNSFTSNVLVFIIVAGIVLTAIHTGFHVKNSKKKM